MIFSSRILAALGLCVGVSAIIIACGSKEDSTFSEGPGPSPFGGGNEGGIGSSSGSAADANLEADPFPKWCGPGAPPATANVTGTEQCPSDKNIPGCTCTTPGATAACFTGLRRQRNLGI